MRVHDSSTRPLKHHRIVLRRLRNSSKLWMYQCIFGGNLNRFTFLNYISLLLLINHQFCFCKIPHKQKPSKIKVLFLFNCSLVLTLADCFYINNQRLQTLFCFSGPRRLNECRTVARHALRQQHSGVNLLEWPRHLVTTSSTTFHGHCSKKLDRFIICKMV